MNRALIFDVDGTLSETEETHRKAFNRAFAEAGLPWHWDQDLYRQLLAVTGGKERIRYFIRDFGAKGAPGDKLDEFIRSLHAEKTLAYTQMVTSGDVELRPGIRELINDARERGIGSRSPRRRRRPTLTHCCRRLLATMGTNSSRLFARATARPIRNRHQTYTFLRLRSSGCLLPAALPSRTPETVCYRLTRRELRLSLLQASTRTIRVSMKLLWL